MSVQIEALSTSALGLQAPWEMLDVRLVTNKQRIDFDGRCKSVSLTRPACDVAA